MVLPISRLSFLIELVFVFVVDYLPALEQYFEPFSKERSHPVSHFQLVYFQGGLLPKPMHAHSSDQLQA